MAAGGLNSMTMSLRTPEDNPLFVDLPKGFICPVCGLVLHNAYQLMCGHHVCEKCIDTLFGLDEIVDCPTKDEECGKIDKKACFRDAFKRKEALKLKVYCNYKEAGCAEVMTWKMLADHVIKCDYRPVPCTYVNDGCSFMGPVNTMRQHLDIDCQYVLVNCPHCSEQMKRLELKDHEMNTCPQVIESCPNQCGTQDLPRIQMREHIGNCPKQPKKCPYDVIGCQFQGIDEEIQMHITKDSTHHLELVLPFAKHMDELNKQTQAGFEAIKAERDKLIQETEQLKRTVAELKGETKSYKPVINDLKIKIVGQTEKILNMEDDIKDFAKKDVVIRSEREIKYLKEQQEKCSEKVIRMEQGGLVGGTAGNVETTDRNVSQQLGNIVQQLKNHDRQIAIQDIRMAELDLKFQILETANYDGNLMWKIRDYSRRKQEAINGRTLSLYSQPFYTDKFGYKMCSRVYLNGDGMGRGTHLSLFFVVMQGEYDALLPWPFKQKVTMKILDYDTCGRQPFEDDFQPDPTSSSYRRPVTEMNVATGCPLFVSHAVLETRKYIRDDTLFIKIEVDTGIQR